MLSRLVLVMAVVLALPARADDTEGARAHYRKGLSAYALGQFKEAAVEYEAAFALTPDPALLYNAAQAHRIAGEKERALLLYENYLRLFPDRPNEKEVRRHISALRAAIDSDARAKSSPPVNPMSAHVQPEASPAPESRPPPATTAPTASTRESTNPTVLTTTTTPPAKKKTPAWVWGVVGGVAGAVVIGVAVGLAVGLSGTRYPGASSTVTLK